MYRKPFAPGFNIARCCRSFWTYLLNAEDVNRFYTYTWNLHQLLNTSRLKPFDSRCEVCAQNLNGRGTPRIPPKGRHHSWRRLWGTICSPCSPQGEMNPCTLLAHVLFHALSRRSRRRSTMHMYLHDNLDDSAQRSISRSNPGVAIVLLICHSPCSMKNGLSMSRRVFLTAQSAPSGRNILAGVGEVASCKTGRLQHR